ncbi:uncharacterized protein PO1_contig-026-41 [Mycobacterium sp. PO1]|nr:MULTISPECIES: hypothetical protein [unclassified Mycobacterium]GFM18353.1 uncharacterized protein PO1_contig-026-41 [Mycobacterium sp. PO1]GFM24373.1 uncharacterized protein PO2_contig-037-41 [Mycobacterium sp. PO2]
MRAEEEGIDPVEAQDAVLRDNLFGLELDPRCVQIAMFALAFQAWKAGGGWRQVPVPNVACSGIPVKASVAEWTKLAGGDERLENALVRLHILFRDADTLGSLIDPKQAAELTDPSGLQHSFEDVEWDDLAPILEKAVETEVADPVTAVLGADAAGIVRAADYLSRRYTLVATNVPYLSRSNQSDILRSFCDRLYPLSKHDLATVMLERIGGLSRQGTAATVLPQGWTQLSRYKSLRSELLRNWSIKIIAFLGAGAFGSISGEVVNVILWLGEPQKYGYDDSWVAFDVSSQRTIAEKVERLTKAEGVAHKQTKSLENPDARILAVDLPSGPLMSEKASSLYGLRTGDGARLIRYFWELGSIGSEWRYHQGTTLETNHFSGRESVLFWESGDGVLAELAKAGIASLQGEGAWGKGGIVVSLMGDLPVTRYTGESFDNNCAVVWPHDEALLPALWCFISDPSYSTSVRLLDRSLKVTNQTLLKVPFDPGYWNSVAKQRFPDGLPEPWSDDPTQWLFEGRPEVSNTPLQVAVARLVGYRWPEQAESDDLEAFPDADGIVCLPSVAGEAPAADRLQQLLAAAYGDRWSPSVITQELQRAGSKKKSIADWLRDDFFKQHCAVFGNRPFVWHIWDGQRDGFSALVNYHKLDRKTLEKLTYTYLGTDWVERQKAEVRDEVAGAEARLAAATDLQRRLELILEGEAPYDIYVRWKETHGQPIGWEPDLNDGVRLNIRPFVEAGVLRSAFNIHWRKDRGKNPDGTERHNDIHLTLADKDNARRSEGRV